MSIILLILGLSTFDNLLIEDVEHEFHFSKTLIEYAEEEQSLQVTMHIFIDDLEEALALLGAEKLFICTEKESPDAENFMAQYFTKHFQITVNGEQIAFEFLGKEVAEDLMGAWCYLEFKGVTAIKTLEIKNTILTEVFNDQKNVISIIGPNQQREYVMFDKNNMQKTFDF